MDIKQGNDIIDDILIQNHIDHSIIIDEDSKYCKYLYELKDYKTFILFCPDKSLVDKYTKAVRLTSEFRSKEICYHTLCLTEDNVCDLLSLLPKSKLENRLIYEGFLTRVTYETDKIIRFEIQNGKECINVCTFEKENFKVVRNLIGKVVRMEGRFKQSTYKDKERQWHTDYSIICFYLGKLRDI